MGRRTPSRLAGDALAAGLAGAACSALPSSAWALLRGDDVLEAARAVGVMVLPHERRTPVLLIAAGTVHLAISLVWSAVIAAVLPRRAEPAWGVAAAVAIAALDLAVIGRRLPAIRALPQGRQWADHVAGSPSGSCSAHAGPADRLHGVSFKRRHGPDDVLRPLAYPPARPGVAAVGMGVPPKL